LILTIDEHGQPQDTSLTSARTETSTTDANLISGVKGSGVGVYMSETGCPAAFSMPNYTWLAGSETLHSRNVLAIMRTISPSSWFYCRGDSTLPSSSDLAGSGGHPAIHIVNFSAGIVSPNSAYDSLAATYDNWSYLNRIPLVLTAGNAGATTGFLVSPGMALNATTAGNYQDHTGPGMNINQIYSESSYINPTSKNNKPELSAPGVDINAGGGTFTGTSQAAPFVTAIATDYMSAYTFLKGRPALVRSTLIAAAMDSVNGGFDKAGYGGIDYLSGYGDAGFWWYEGPNGSFASWAANDDDPLNGRIDAPFWANAGARVRLVVSWLNRGSWTLAHLSDSHPIGIDLDVLVTGPSGFGVGSASYDDSAEVVTFTAPSSANYVFHIQQFANRDPTSDLVIGVVVNRD
jgi:hypothetical protein